jgi:hypothetical protein
MENAMLEWWNTRCWSAPAQATRGRSVANPHFANLGDVWKHLWLTGALGQVRPVQYVETHAGSALYRLVDDVERAIGVRARHCSP